MFPRCSTPLLLLFTFAGCGTADEAPPTEMRPSHSWRVPAGASVFAEANLGAVPESAADAWMATMPGVVHRMGEACKEQIRGASADRVVVRFDVLEGQAVGLFADPKPLESCFATALAGETAVLAKGPLGPVGLWLSVAAK